MLKCFLKALIKIFFVYLLGAFAIASDVAQLTDFNILDFIQSHSPLSYFYIAIITILLYFVLVIIEFKKLKRQSNSSGDSCQSVIARNIKNSTIIQIAENKGIKK